MLDSRAGLQPRPEIRFRDIADNVGITLGTAQRILADLVEAGYVKRERHGRATAT